MDNSAIMCYEVMDADEDAELNDQETKTFPTNFNEKKVGHKRKIFYLHFY